MYPPHLLSLLLTAGPVAASSILFSGGTIIAFKKGDSSTPDALEVIRNGDVLVTDDRISGIYPGPAPANEIPEGTEIVNITNKIISTGFVDTHKHGWQTAFKTLASNTTLGEYFLRYGEYAAEGLFTPDDVYYGQLTGIYEALNAGVTTILDHAHHTWDNGTSEAGLRASIDSGARIFWSYTFHPLVNFTVQEQIANFRDIAERAEWVGSPTVLGIAYDGFGPDPDVDEVDAVMALVKEYDIPVVTTHALGGPWSNDRSPSDLEALGYLNTSTAIVFSHAAGLTATDATLLRKYNQFVSITPESEMHYGHGHPVHHLILDQASLGVDTHFTFSGDILFQARLWLQATRRTLHQEVLDRWHVHASNPFSANQAFLLATRNGGLSLHREDIGVLSVGAKADLVVWDGTSPSLLGWKDPIAAVILHANVGDIQHVVVDGKWKKRDFRLVDENYQSVTRRFLDGVERIQTEMGRPERNVMPLTGGFLGDPDAYPYEDPVRVDVLRGEGDGYGGLFLD